MRDRAFTVFATLLALLFISSVVPLHTGQTLGFAVSLGLWIGVAVSVIFAGYFDYRVGALRVDITQSYDDIASMIARTGPIGFPHERLLPYLRKYVKMCNYYHWLRRDTALLVHINEMRFFVAGIEGGVQSDQHLPSAPRMLP